MKDGGTAVEGTQRRALVEKSTSYRPICSIASELARDFFLRWLP